jgi:hypothetical protein
MKYDRGHPQQYGHHAERATSTGTARFHPKFQRNFTKISLQQYTWDSTWTSQKHTLGTRDCFAFFVETLQDKIEGWLGKNNKQPLCNKKQWEFDTCAIAGHAIPQGTTFEDNQTNVNLASKKISTKFQRNFNEISLQQHCNSMPHHDNTTTHLGRSRQGQLRSHLALRGTHSATRYGNPPFRVSLSLKRYRTTTTQHHNTTTAHHNTAQHDQEQTGEDNRPNRTHKQFLKRNFS